jgi:hypothetical protein
VNSSVAVAEEIVLLASRAMRTLQAAKQKHGNACRYQSGEEVFSGDKAAQ